MLVRSDLKGQGIGLVLMQHLIAYAEAERLSLMEGDVLSENLQMLRMCRLLGFRMRSDPRDPGLQHVVLQLGSGAAQSRNPG